MIRRLPGIQVFQMTDELENKKELLEIQYLSALAWKRLYGIVELYTNEKWLKEIEALGFDGVYNHIDIEVLSTIPKEVDQKKFWAYGKIHVASKISHEEFVLLDNDLWITKELNFDDRMAFMGYHYENFDTTDIDSPYVDFENLIPPKYVGKWNKKLMAVNCGLLWIKNQEIKNRWVEVAREIATNPDQVEIEDPHNIRYMIFLEQRLLPMLAAEMNLPYGAFLNEPVYQARKVEDFSGNVWDPTPEKWSKEVAERFYTIRHIWGGKKLWKDYPEIKNMQMKVVYEDLQYVCELNEVEQFADVRPYFVK